MVELQRRHRLLAAAYRADRKRIEQLQALHPLHPSRTPYTTYTPLTPSHPHTPAHTRTRPAHYLLTNRTHPHTPSHTPAHPLTHPPLPSQALNQQYATSLSTQEQLQSAYAIEPQPSPQP